MGAFNLKIIATGLCLLAFLTSHTLYTWILTSQFIDQCDRDLWKATNYIFIITTTYILIKIGVSNFLQSQLIEVIFFVVVATLLITVLTNTFIVLQPYKVMATIDLGTMIATLMILISAYRHGFFKD